MEPVLSEALLGDRTDTVAYIWKRLQDTGSAADEATSQEDYSYS